VSIYREGDNLIPIVLRAGANTSESLEGLTSVQIPAVSREGSPVRRTRQEFG